MSVSAEYLIRYKRVVIRWLRIGVTRGRVRSTRRVMLVMLRRLGHCDVVMVELGALGVARDAAPERTTANLVCHRRVCRIVLNGVHAIQADVLRVAPGCWV